MRWVMLMQALPRDTGLVVVVVVVVFLFGDIKLPNRWKDRVKGQISLQKIAKNYSAVFDLRLFIGSIYAIVPISVSLW